MWDLLKNNNNNFGHSSNRTVHVEAQKEVELVGEDPESNVFYSKGLKNVSSFFFFTEI